jgi:hypothetical protein
MTDLTGKSTMITGTRQSVGVRPTDAIARLGAELKSGKDETSTHSPKSHFQNVQP